MMTLDEAIQRERHAMRQTAGERSDEHRQMAEWLRELVALKAENAELRYEVHVLEGGNKGLQILNDSLKTDNVRLRDLVDLMLSCPMDKGDCDKCRQLNDMCEVEVLTGELGIEVE